MSAQTIRIYEDEPSSPEDAFMLYLFQDWSYALNIEMVVAIGQKAKELFTQPGGNQCNCFGSWHDIGSQGCTMVKAG